MAYPSLEQYNEALQAPQLFLLDSQLKGGVVRTTGLGTPMALCGGFALTYSIEVSGKRYALRCFHKEAPELERRYQVISHRLKKLSSPYFLPFEFEPNGIRINGKVYPIVKMAWASGETLSEFLEREHGNSSSIHRLRAALAKLSDFLEAEHIAHGDIQPGNVMVSQQGATVQLIDYDGLFVEALRGNRATELGQLNFQHPQRSASYFNECLDRFSFIALDVALQALAADPGLWRRAHCDPDAVIFRRSDFLAPGVSPVFKELLRLPNVEAAAKGLAQIASASIDKVPKLADFLQLRNIPASTVSFVGTSQVFRAAYQGAYRVLEASNYAEFLAEVGNKVELVGRIHAVVSQRTKHGKPYVFINFSDWRGNAVKLTIWAEGLKALGNEVPNGSWVGRWVAISGLVEPPYPGKGYTHISMNVAQRGQLQQLTEDEARYRLGKTQLPDRKTEQGESGIRNSEIIRNMSGSKPAGGRKTAPATNKTAPAVPAQTQKSGNQQVLEQMRRSRGVQTPAVSPSVPSQVHRQAPPVKKGSGGAWFFIVLAVVLFVILIGG